MGSLSPAADAALCSAAFLKQLLGAGQPACTEGDPALGRRLQVAAPVYSHWTCQGAEPAAAAGRYLDASADVLAEYVATAAPRGRGRGNINVVHASDLSYEDFVRRYMAPNVPVLILGVADAWQATREWVLPDGSPHLQLLAKRFGSAQVSVHDSGSSYGQGSVQAMSLAGYVAWWQAVKAAGQPATLYLKDWHFVAEHPEHQAYSTPVYAQEDWLNEFFDAKCAASGGAAGEDRSERSDYRFLYLGPAGSSTPVHADVLRSFSWSVNVCGRKARLCYRHRQL